MSAYHSTLPVRKSEVTRADFRDVFNLSVDEMAPGLISGQSLHWWNAHIPIAPYDLYGLFTRNFADGITVDVDPTRDAVKISVRSEQANKFEGEIYIFKDSFKDAREPDSRFHVDEPYQGQGIGKSWMKSLVELHVALGEKDFRFSAGSTNGAYTWASMGADLDMSPYRQEERKDQSCRVRGRIESMREHMPKEDYRAARVFAHMVDKADPASLAAIRSEVSHESISQIETPGSDVLDKMKKFFERHPVKNKKPWSAAYDEKFYITGVFESAARHGAPTLAKCLLVGTTWPAIIDFGNARQMQRIGNYLGGWDSIRPA